MAQRLRLIVPNADFSGSGLGPIAPMWDPSELGSNLVAWFSAKDFSTITKDGSNNVTAWASKVGSISLTNQHSEADKAVYDANAWPDDGPAMIFSTGTGLVSGTVLAASGFPTNDPGFMVWAVVRRKALLDGTGVDMRAVVTLPTAFVSSVRQQGFLGFVRPGLDAAQTEVIAGQHVHFPTANSISTPLAVNEYGIVAGEFRDAAPLIQSRISGGAAGVAANYFGTAGGSTICIGGMNNTNDSQSGATIREVVVTKIISGANRQKMEGYLAWSNALVNKLPDDHPYKSDGPY